MKHVTERRKAAVYERYGPPDVVKVQTVERPAFGPNDVLVKVYSTTVTTGDWRLRSMRTGAVLQIAARLMFGIFKPRNRILGGAFAGRVAGIGNAVSRFQVGDEVIGVTSHGAHAEFVVVGEDKTIVAKPDGVSFDDAAAVPFGGISALVFLRDVAKLKAGQKLLVTGASGGVGVFAVQIGKLLGAEVTGLASTKNVALVSGLGADTVINYKDEDFTKRSSKFDVVFDTAGVTRFAKVRHMLTEDGLFVPLEFGVTEILQSMGGGDSGKRVRIGISSDKRDDLELLVKLLDEGQLTTVIDSRYPIEEISTAHRRVEGRHKRGAVVVTVDEPVAAVG